jgi:hypothetical protein
MPSSNGSCPARQGGGRDIPRDMPPARADHTRHNGACSGQLTHEEIAWDEVVRDIVCDFPVPRPGQCESGSGVRCPTRQSLLSRTRCD